MGRLQRLGYNMARALVKTISGTPEQIQAKGLQLGDIKHSLLDEVTFQSKHGTSWVLSDGRNISGSDLAVLTGWTVAPDLRGVFLRGKDHGAGVNPDGDTPEGTYQLDEFASHTHSTNYQHSDNGDGAGYALINVASFAGSTDGSTTSQGGLETRPKNIIVNYFIKINEE